VSITEPQVLARFSRRYFPGATVLTDLSWPHRESIVLVLAVPNASPVIAKAHRQAAKFDREVAAYEGWVPSLGPAAPELLFVDPDEQVIFLSRVPGRPAKELSLDRAAEQALHRRAGELLAAFHAAANLGLCNNHAEGERDRLEDWVVRARPGVLGPSQIEIARHHVDALGGLGDPPAVPTHRDWQPRNWLLDRGDVYIIDFELARRGPWLEDIQRLWWAEWWNRPDLARAFLTAYGRDLDETDLAYLMGISAIAGISTIVWADEHGDNAFADHGRQILDRLA
jgi:aminoglycoside/choline kinase family phosphotransferase